MDASTSAPSLALAYGFTKLVVRDLGVAEPFYEAVFGMEPVGRVTADEHAYALDEVILTLGGAQDAHRLILVRYLHRPTPPAGAAWTGFIVPDIAASLSRVTAHGGRIEVPVHENTEFRTLAAIVADPDGHLIEIIQMLG